MFDFLTDLRRHLTLADYHDDLAAVADGVVVQITLGNGSIQNGWIIDEDAQKKLSQQADVSMRYLEACARKQSASHH